MDNRANANRTPAANLGRKSLLWYAGGATAVGLGYWWWTHPGQTRKTDFMTGEPRDTSYKAVKKDASRSWEDTKEGVSHAYAGAKSGLSEASLAARQGAQNISEDLRSGAKRDLRSAADSVRDAAHVGQEMAMDRARDLKEAIEKHATMRDTGRDVLDTADRVRASPYGVNESMMEKGRDMAESVKEKSRDMAENVKEKGKDLMAAARDKAGDLKEMAVDMKDKVKERARDLDTTNVNPIRPTADVAKDRFERLEAQEFTPAVASHARKAQIAEQRAEQDREVLRDKETSLAERAKAAGDLALRRAEGAYHEAARQRATH